MRVMVLLLALASAFALAADNAVIAPRTAGGHKPQASAYGAEAITIPHMLSYQGRLTDTLGVPVGDTTYQATFRLYTVATGGASFWNETQTVRTRGGLFSALLGSVAQIESVPSSGNLYLGMAVAGGAELSPRLRLVGSAYSYLAGKSANADLLQGKDTAALDSRYVNEGQASSVTSNMIVDGTIAAADLGQMGASTGQVMKWTGSAWTPRNDSVGSGGSGGTVRKVVQASGVVCSPNPITDSGTVRLDTTYSDGRYIKNQFASNQSASWRIAGQGRCSANSDGDAAIKGTNASTTGYGVWGYSSDHYGVYGSTTSGCGVCGYSSASGNGVYGSSNSGSGVSGLANSGPGVYGSSGTSHGVIGSSSSGYGVYGGSSGSCGVAGNSTSNDGVYGKSSASGYAGVHGTSTAGMGGYGVWGEDSLGFGVYGVSYDNYGVYGNSNTSYGVIGRSASSFGVAGISMGSYGAYDSSGASTGVYGVTAGTNQSGVAGVSHGSGGTGVFGHANGGGTNIGAHGLADGNSVNYGLYGDAGGTGSNYGVYGHASGGATNYAGYFNGDVTVTGNLSKGGGSFQIDHPLDPPNKYLLHSFVESPDMMNIYNGNVVSDVKGYATVSLPDWFEALNRDFRYQLTVIDERDGDGFAQAKVVRGVKDNSFVIRTSVPLTTVSWQVTGIRQDPYANLHRVQVEVTKPTGERGKYIHPQAYGLPKEAGIGYRPALDDKKAGAAWQEE